MDRDEDNGHDDERQSIGRSITCPQMGYGKAADHEPQVARAYAGCAA